MSKRLLGRECAWEGKKRPDHAAYMRKWWTQERREKMRQRQLKPTARYHGLSSRQAAALVRKAGKCNRCGHSGSVHRLGVHHRDRDKHNQAPTNLEVLCHRCHTKDHQRGGETGWGAYWRKRRNSQD